MKKTTLVLLASLPLLAPILEAQTTVHTNPVGFINLTIKGTDAGKGLTGISVPMLPQALYSGVITGSTTSTITDNNATWADDQYVGLDPNGSPTHYIEITANANDATTVGSIIGILDSDDAANELSLNGDPSGLDGASYVIRQCHTIASVFGDANSAGLTTGQDLASSDVIFKMTNDGNAGMVWGQYYYQTDPTVALDPTGVGFLGGTGWRSDKSSSSDLIKNTVILPTEGLIVRRISDGDVTVTLPGSIKMNNSKTQILKGYNLVSLNYPVEMTLEGLGIQSMLRSGQDSSSSDRVYHINGAGAFDIYYYQTDPTVALDPTGVGFLGGTGWRKSGFSATDAKDSVIPAGHSVIVYREDQNQTDWNSTVPFN